jgi:hypothetical protein
VRKLPQPDRRKLDTSRISRKGTKNAKKIIFNFAASRERNRELLNP